MNVACKWSMLGKVRTPIHKIKTTISGILSKFSIKFKWLQQIFKAFKRWRPTERHLHPCPVNGKSWISSSTAKCNVIRLPKKEHLRKHSLRPFTAVSSARYMYVHMYIHTYTYVHICRFLQGQVGGVCARLIGFDCAYNRYILGRHIGTGTVCMYVCTYVCMHVCIYVRNTICYYLCTDSYAFWRLSILSIAAHHQGHGSVVARGMLRLRRPLQEAAGGHLLLRAGRSSLLPYRLWATVRGSLRRLQPSHNGECDRCAQCQMASRLLQVQGEYARAHTHTHTQISIYSILMLLFLRIL